MRIIKASYWIELLEEPIEMLKRIERTARRCFKSEDSITDTSYLSMMKKLVIAEHWPMFDHAFMSVTFTTDRGVSHELCRHRLTAIAQESTRYCNYSKDKFGNEIGVIDIESHLKSPQALVEWAKAMEFAEKQYLKLLELGESAQIARSVLPNSLKTEITLTCDITEWRHIFKLRTSPKAHPQMRELMVPLLRDFKQIIPIVFDDIEEVSGD